jgi:hypothetical protein
MLPDLDSDSGVPLREMSMFWAAVVPMLMIDRFRDLGLSTEAMAVAAMLIYVAIRFIAVEFFKRYTVHRGMWHSLPAAASSGFCGGTRDAVPKKGCKGGIWAVHCRAMPSAARKGRGGLM